MTKALKNLLLLLLSLSVLAYGSAWAFDGHVMEADSNETGLFYQASHPLPVAEQAAALHDRQADGHPADTEHASHQGCDHCCHISAHLQAIFPAQAGICCDSSSRLLRETSEDLLSLFLDSEPRPPRV